MLVLVQALQSYNPETLSFITIGPAVSKTLNPKHLKIIRKTMFGKTAF